jgi:hypothetical protein
MNDPTTPEGGDGEDARLVLVPFYGDDIHCYQDHRGVWLSIPKLCDNLGVDAQGQTRKLREKAWGWVEMISTHDGMGRPQETWCMHMKTMPLWLATIDANRVAERTRPKLIAYQKECAEVLHAHFFKPLAPPAPPPQTTVGLSLETVIAAMAVATSTAIQQALPVITKAVAQTLREDREEERRRQDVIGRWGAGLVRRSVREASRLLGKSDDDKHLRAIVTGLHQDLRRELDWGGSGRTWPTYPMHRFGDLKDALNRMLLRAQREGATPQLSLLTEKPN